MNQAVCPSCEALGEVPVGLEHIPHGSCGACGYHFELREHTLPDASTHPYARLESLDRRTRVVTTWDKIQMYDGSFR